LGVLPDGPLPDGPLQTGPPDGPSWHEPLTGIRSPLARKPDSGGPPAPRRALEYLCVRPSRRVLGDGPLDGGPLFEPDQGPFDGARFASKVPSPLQRPCDRKGPNQSTGPLRLLLGRPSGSASTEGPSASTEGRLFEPADDPNDGLSDGAGLDDTVPDPIRSTGASTPPGVYRINRVPRRVYGPSPKAVEAVLDGPGDCEAEDGLLDGPSDRLLTGAGPDAGPRAGPRAAPDTVSRGADGPFLAGPSWRALCAVGSGPFRGPSAPFL